MVVRRKRSILEAYLDSLGQRKGQSFLMQTILSLGDRRRPWASLMRGFLGW